MKFLLPVLTICSLLLNACSNPISQSKQIKLIESESIKIDMNCKDLMEMLGGHLAITMVYVEQNNRAENLLNSSLLISTASKHRNKHFYFCDRKRDEFVKSISSEKHVADYDLIEVFTDPFLMMEFVISTAATKSRGYILTELNLNDYNLTRADVAEIIDKVEKSEVVNLDEELQKADENLKKEKKEKLINPEQEILRKKLLEQIE